MTRISKYCERIALSIAVVGGLCALGLPALAHGTTSRTEIRSAQHQLKTDGYYNGKIDGVDGVMTRAAIRQYQKANGLIVNGHLDRATRHKLGVMNYASMEHANRSRKTSSSNSATSDSSTAISPSTDQGMTGANNPNTDQQGMKSTNPSTDQGMNGNNTMTGNNAAMNQTISKSEIKSAQQQLKQKGLYTGRVDGVMGPGTQAAVRKYQQGNGLTASGQLDQNTLTSLGVTK